MLAFFTRLLGDPSFSLLLPRSTLVVRLREGGFQYPLGDLSGLDQSKASLLRLLEEGGAVGCQRM